MVSTMLTLLSIIILPFIQLTSSINCGSLQIKCASGSSNCYSGACGKMASHMIGMNSIPIHTSKSPTMLIFSLSPTPSPTHLPTVTRFAPTPKPTTNTPTIPPTVPTSTTNTQISCTQCNCDCSLCNASEQCMQDGPNCIWLFQQCHLIPDGIFPTTSTTILPTTNIPTTKAAIPTTQAPVPTTLPTTTTSITTTKTPTTVTTNEPITLRRITCGNYINGLYGTPSDTVLFHLTITEEQFVKFDACHSDLPPYINLYNENRNEILNKCNIFNGCCGIDHNHQGLITKLLPGDYYFEFTYDEIDWHDLQAVGRNVAIYHIHIICTSTETSTISPADDDDEITSSTTTKNPTTTTTTKSPTTRHPTPRPTTTRMPTVRPTTRPLPFYPTAELCTECDCDCTLCVQAEQCMVIGSNCIWLHGHCITITPDNGNDNGNENDLCPLEIIENTDMILLVDNSCGLSDHECMIRQGGISKFMNGIVSVDNTYPRIGYIAYTNADDINILLPLTSNSVSATFNVIENIENYKCNGNDTNVMTYSTDLAAGISVAIREFANTFDINQPSDRLRKMVIFSNCRDTMDTVSPCTLINELSSDFYIEVIVVNIPCKNQSHDYDINALQCLTMNTTQRYITLSNNTVIGFDDKISTFKSAVCGKITTNAPTVSPPTCPQIGELCTSAYKSEDRCCNGHKRQGFARCQYTGYDSFGHKLGKCCVRKNRPGCSGDVDCCTKDDLIRVCYKGYCLSRPKIDRWRYSDDLAIEITENGDFAEWSTTFEDTDDDGKIFGLDRASQIFGLIIIFLCIICNLLYCYWHFGVRKKGEDEVDNDTEIDMDYIHRNCMYHGDDENDAYWQQHLQQPL